LPFLDKIESIILTQIELDQLNGNTIELDQLNKTELEDLN